MKKNNKGFTLIEVLVAASILVIVAIPLIRTFVTSSSINAKSKWSAKAIDVGQNLMEGIKNIDIEQMALQFNYPGDAGANFTTIAQKGMEGAGEFIKDGTKYAKVPTYGKETGLGEWAVLPSEKQSSIYSTDDGATFDFVPKANGIYYFGLKGVKDRGMTFDALLKVDASVYQDGGNYGAAKGPNSKERINIMNLDETQDAIFVQPMNQDDVAAKYFQKANEGDVGTYSIDPIYDYRDLLDKIKREITFVIDNKQILGGINQTTVKVICKYTCPTTYVSTANSVYTERELTLFNNQESQKELKSIYVFYNPLYTNGSDLNDQIIIENEKNIPIDLHVIKQESKELRVANKNEFVNKENAYRMRLIVKDKMGNSTSKSSVRLFTNLNENLYKEDAAAPVILPQATYKYAPNMDNIDYHTSQDAANFFGIKDLANRTADNYIYDVSIEIYKKGAFEKGFEEGERLATYKGSKVN